MRSLRVVAVAVLTLASTFVAAAPGDATAGRRPVIVIDPGHSPTIHRTDPRTHLDVSDYANEPEMRDVYAVALLVAAKLRADGYRVILTKTRSDQRVSLARRAQIANDAHADLALSIHDQAGAQGGIRFHRANNIVYYQSVGSYRATRSGHHVVFADRQVAALSHRYAAIFRAQRSAREHHHVIMKRNVGYDLGGRGLAGGNIWMVQLLSHVPWIYNEAGGNSGSHVGLTLHNKRLYAAGLVAGVERCVPRPH